MHIFSSLLLLTILSVGIAQAQWEPSLTRTSHTLRAIATIGADTVFAVGDSGTIVRSVDAGDTWNPIPSLTRNHLAGVAMRGRQALAVGVAGTVCHTRNGILWTSATVPGVHFADVAWTGDSRAIAVGYTTRADSGVIVMTIDSARTWVRVPAPLPSMAHVLTSIAVAPDGLHGVIGGHLVGSQGRGEAFVLLTTDGGYRWERVVVSEADAAIEDVAMPTTATIHVVGSTHDNVGAIWRSDDRGRRWRQVDIGDVADVRSIRMVDRRRGAVVATTIENVGGQQRPVPLVLSTVDGGRTWRRTRMDGVDAMPTALSVNDDGAAIVLGTEGAAYLGNVVHWAPAQVYGATPVIECGAWPVGTARFTTAVVLRNTSAAPLDVTGLAIIGDEPFDLPGGPLGPRTLTPGEELRVTFRFTPSVEGTYEAVAQLRLANGRDLPIYLSGSADGLTVDEEPIVFDRPFIDLGSLPMSAERDTVLTAIIRNTGTTPRVLRNVWLDGVDVAGYGIRSAPEPEIELAPGETADIHIQCNAPHVGPFLAHLVLETDAGRRRLPLVSVRSADAWDPVVDIDSMSIGTTVAVEQGATHPYDVEHTIGLIDIPDASVLVTGTTPSMPAYVAADSIVTIAMNLYPRTVGTWLIPMRVQWDAEWLAPSSAERRVLRTVVTDGPTSVPHDPGTQADVAPQPASDRAVMRHASLRQGASWTLVDLRGRVIRSGSVDADGELVCDLRGVASGQYSIVTAGDHGPIVAAVIVQ